MAVCAIFLWIQPLILPSGHFVMLHRLVADRIVMVVVFNMEFSLFALQLELKHLKSFLVKSCGV
jgi:hypothetical protein